MLSLKFLHCQIWTDQEYQYYLEITNIYVIKNVNHLVLSKYQLWIKVKLKRIYKVQLLEKKKIKLKAMLSYCKIINIFDQRLLQRNK